MSKPNVLLIVVDQWRGDVLSALGTPHLKTPNIDRLSREGVTFRNHVTTAVPCGPARACLLTGMYQMNNRVVQNTIPFASRHRNLATELRAVGYDPALIGYTTTAPDPTTTPPNDPRFSWLGDIMEGFRPVGAFEPEKEAYFGWVASKGYELPENRDDIWLPEGEDTVPGATAKPARIPAELSDTAFFTDCALRYLKGVSADRPFFLHLGYWRPHPPFIASAPYHTMYRPDQMAAPIRASSVEKEAEQHPLLDFYLRKTANASFFQGAEGHVAGLTEDEIKQMRATYFGMMSEIDDGLGKVFAELDAQGKWDDTLIIFTSDHGEQLGDHHLLGKIGYFDESFRIPLIVKDPRRKDRAGEIDASFTESVDVMPTIIDWLDGTVPHTCDGHSLLAILDGNKPADWRQELHYEYDYRDVHYSRPEAFLGVGMDEAGLCVVQDDDYKYVHFTALPPLFFDLKKDPHQFDNVAENPAYDALVKIYAQKMLSWRMRHPDRTLTAYRTTPAGLENRAAEPKPTDFEKDF